MKLKMPNSDEQRWNGPFIVCILAIAITAVIAVSAIPGVASAVFSPAPNVDTSAVIDSLLKNHEEVAIAGKDRFLGRSPFFVPKRPPNKPRPRPVVREPERDPEPVRETTPPGPPSTYSGPKPTSLLGANVFFRTTDSWIEVGEEKNGVSVIKIKDPWTVTLGHKGGEYDVSLWGDREDSFFKERYDGSVRSSGIVENERDAATSRRSAPPTASRPDPARGGTPPSDFNSKIPIPDPIGKQKIASMTRREVSDSLKDVMAAMRRTDLDEATRKRLQEELDELRSKLRTAS